MNEFLAWLTKQQAIFDGHGWIMRVFIAVLVTVIANYSWKITYKRIYPRLQKTKAFWDDAILKALHKPISVLIWIIGLSFASLLVAPITGSVSEIFKLVPDVRNFGIILMVVWFFIRFITQLEKKLVHPKTETMLDTTTVYALGKVLRAAVIITGALVGLQTFGIGISGVLAFGGLSGAALAFAAKDLLANFFGGLVIYMDRPFAVGDWIRSPDREIEGTVEYIGWRLCRIRTFDKRPLYVPNSVFTTISVENPSRMSNRRIKTNIGVRYDDASKIPYMLADIEAMLKNHQEIDTKQTLMVNLINFAPSSLEFFIYTFTKTTNWVKFQAIQQDVFLKTIEIITKHGAECAFPTTTLHVPDGVYVREQENLNQDTTT